jgi:hypothetical protein
MKRLGVSFGSREPRALPCLFNLITLIAYLFSLLPFACLACFCACLCSHTLAHTPYPIHGVLSYQQCTRTGSVSLNYNPYSNKDTTLWIFFVPKHSINDKNAVQTCFTTVYMPHSSKYKLLSILVYDSSSQRK